MGFLQLAELPQEVSERVQVIVTFLESDRIDPSKLRQLMDQLSSRKAKRR